MNTFIYSKIIVMYLLVYSLYYITILKDGRNIYSADSSSILKIYSESIFVTKFLVKHPWLTKQRTMWVYKIPAYTWDPL